jgi:inward rectifier potassium channel
LKLIVSEQSKRKQRDQTMRIGAGAVEIVKRGAPRYDFSDPYHIAIEMSWKEFALAFVGLELGINTIFALLYLTSPGCIANMRPGSFSDALFFSALRHWRPWATERWLRPHSMDTPSAIEIVCGHVFTAIMTGLLFVRFSKPRPKILFADQPVASGAPPPLLVIANRASHAGQCFCTHVMRPV